ncbi:hypothetical protein WKT22_01740 [Candidatus Lokiarchaeum ossiferum]
MNFMDVSFIEFFLNIKYIYLNLFSKLMKHGYHKNHKRFVLGICLVICLNIAFFGILMLNNFPEREICPCNKPGPYDSLYSGIEVDDRKLHILTHPMNSSEIRYLWFDLSVNSSLFPNLKYFTSFESSWRDNNGFFCHLKSDDRWFDQFRYPMEQNLTQSLKMKSTVSVSWMEWRKEIISDMYLDLHEQVRVYIIIGSNDVIKWGDTLTLNIGSGCDDSSVHLDFIVKLPIEASLYESTYQGIYNNCYTRFQ